MKKYLYSYPTPCVCTLTTKGPDGKVTSIDVNMHKGVEYVLPENNGFVKVLIAKGRLALVQVAASAVVPAPQPSTLIQPKN